MKSIHLLAGLGMLSLTASCAFGDETTTNPSPDAIEKIQIVMGDGQINGDQIEPYDFVWTQCTFQAGEWVNGPPLRETLEIRSDGNFELSQFSDAPDGQRTVITHVLDRQSLRRIELTQTVIAPDDTRSERARLRFSVDGFTVQAGGEERPGGAISSNMYGGAYLGLPLSTLDYSSGTFALDAGMLAVQGTYRVNALPAGAETISLDVGSIETQRVDVWWLHHESGDVYEPGPDSSGGRYWLRASNRTDLPRVLAYKTDTYAVEYSPMTCTAK